MFQICNFFLKSWETLYKSRLQELQESWLKLNRQLSRRAETMRRRAKNIKELGAYEVKPKRSVFDNYNVNMNSVMDDMSKTMSRMKRSERSERLKRQSETDDTVDAVIQLTGGVLQSMFGVAYTDDVRKVVDRIDNIDEKLSSNIHQVENSQNNLNSQTIQTLQKQDRTIHKVEDMAKTIENKVNKNQFNPKRTFTFLSTSTYWKCAKNQYWFWQISLKILFVLKTFVRFA